MPKSWREKLEIKRDPKVIPVPARMQRQCGTGTLLVPTPLQVDALIRKIPKGKLATPTQLRQSLARQSGADVTCPMTTGIFIRIAAETAEEDARAGKRRITPYWRVVLDGGGLNEKVPGGPLHQAELLEAEGHQIDRSGKLRVKQIDRVLAKI